MGGSASKRKKYCANDRLRTHRRPSYEESAATRAFLSGDMDHPVYQSLGNPDAYINYCESDEIAHDAVWQPRRKCGDLSTSGADDTYIIWDDKMANLPSKVSDEVREISIKETVLDGPDSDTYDIIPLSLSIRTTCETHSETDLKRTVVSETMHTNKYLEFGSLEKRRRNKHRYEEMVIIFEPLIVQNVIARHLIPHLTFLEEPDKLLAIADRSPRSAVLYIIDELKSNHKDPGRWKQFMEALERCDYSYIAGLLRGESPMDHSYQKEYLKIITPALRISISPIELTQALWSVDVISSEDKEEIEQIYNNLGALAATDRLLDRVPRKHRHWYSHLIDALKRMDMEHAAKMLDIPELQYFSDYEKPLPKQSCSVVHDEIRQDETMNKVDGTSFSSLQQRDDKTTRTNEVSSEDMYEPDIEFYADCIANNTLPVPSKKIHITEYDELSSGDFTCKSLCTVSETRERDSGGAEPNDEDFSVKEQFIKQTLSRSSSICTRLSESSPTEDNIPKQPDEDNMQQSSQMSIGKPPVPLPRYKRVVTNEASEKKDINLDGYDSDDDYVDVELEPTTANIEEESKETGTNNKTLEYVETMPVEEDLGACVKIKTQGVTINRLNRINRINMRSKLHSKKKKITCKRIAQSRHRKQKKIFPKFDIFRRHHKSGYNIRKKEKDNDTNAEQLSSEEQLSSTEQPTGDKETKSNTWPQKLSEVTEDKEYYSQPFINEKRTTDHTHSLSTVKECSHDNNTRKMMLDDTTHTCNRNEDLLILLNNCKDKYGVDGMNENTNAQESSPERITSIHPEVEPLLATVRNQEEELMVLKHQTPVLKATLENQTEINEILKQKRTLVYEISIKNKETSAIKQAIENPNIQDNDEALYTGSTNNNEASVSSARALAELGECQETSERILTAINEEPVINKTDPDVAYKDSAFYSYSERL